MQVKINGKKEEITNTDLLGLLTSKNVEPQMVSVEINSVMLNRADYANTTLNAGDQIEFLYFMGGGNQKANQQASQKVPPLTNILQGIGNTPLVTLNKLASKTSAAIYAKVEFFNPGGSIKDRICIAMIDSAERAGQIGPNTTLVEPTSGNTGIGLALVCAIRGYKLILVMPESMSMERASLLSSYGAQLVLTPAWEGMRGAVKEAESLCQNPDHLMLNQFSNPANPEIHRKTTGPEILSALDGKIDAFVVAVGTGGTLTGVGEVLKAHNPNTIIVAVEPATSPVLSGGEPGPHKIQGIGAGFIPAILNRSIIDKIITVTDDDAYKTAKKLAKQEGLLVGISSGANAYAACIIAEELGHGKNVVTILPDTGERYFSIEKYFNI
jgi:cysteine synthase A